VHTTGHKTRSVFERYNIVSDGDLRDAVRRLDGVAAEIEDAAGMRQDDSSAAVYVGRDQYSMVDPEAVMKVFVSHSGDRSRSLAESLADFVRLTLPAAEPWLSTTIEKGKRWESEVETNVRES
jgi:hypothetical protein